MNKIFVLLVLLVFITLGCKKSSTDEKFSNNIVFLHHSTGEAIWEANTSTFAYKFNKLYYSIIGRKGNESFVKKWFAAYNAKEQKGYQITEQIFPKKSPYGWSNYPYDYYNIWVKNAGEKPYMEEPTLEMLAKKYDVIIWKHCFPVSNVSSDTAAIEINSPKKTIENYKVQYQALKEKMLQFPKVKFIVWTGAVQVQNKISESEATNVSEFAKWVRSKWDSPNDNIYIWDFYELETEGGIYLKSENAVSAEDSHPNPIFAEKAANLLCYRIIDIIENNGSTTTLTGEKIEALK